MSSTGSGWNSARSTAMHRATIASTGRWDHADVRLRELRDGQAFALEFLGGLTESPRIEYDFADVEAGGEGADVVDGLKDALFAVVDPATDV